MRVTIIPVTPFQQNCSLLCCESSGSAAIVDPGGDIDRILAAVEKEHVTVEKIFITHGHIDHIGGAGELAAKLDVPVEGPHQEDRFWIDALPSQSSRFGLPTIESFTPDRWLVGGADVNFGDEVLEVRHCPGHTPGHVIFFHARERLAFVGDVLFRGSIGRTDFPRSNHATLLRSIREQLWPLGDDVTFVPGHGPESTFGEERRTNPFVADR